VRPRGYQFGEGAVGDDAGDRITRTDSRVFAGVPHDPGELGSQDEWGFGPELVFPLAHQQVREAHPGRAVRLCIVQLNYNSVSSHYAEAPECRPQEPRRSRLLQRLHHSD